MKILAAIIFFVCFASMPAHAGGLLLSPNGQPWVSIPGKLVSPRGEVWHAAPGGLMVSPGGRAYIRRLPQPVYPGAGRTPGWPVMPYGNRQAPGFEDPYNSDLMHY